MLLCILLSHWSLVFTLFCVVAVSTETISYFECVKMFVDNSPEMPTAVHVFSELPAGLSVIYLRRKIGTNRPTSHGQPTGDRFTKLP